MDAVARSFDSQSEAMLLGFRSTIMANTVPKVALQPPSPAGNQRRRVNHGGRLWLSREATAGDEHGRGAARRLAIAAG